MSVSTVAVIGGSNDRKKYGNKSVRAHLAEGWQVYPIHPTETTVEGLTAYPKVTDIPVKTVKRVTLYVPPYVGIRLLEEIATMQPEEVWLNPGSESEELIAKAEELGLPIIQACSIRALGTSPARFPDA